MKKFILLGLVFASVLSAQDLKEKIYLNPNEVQVVAQGIFVLMEGNWVQTSKLESDASGIFVKPDQFFPWFCERCQQWTNGWWVCEHCGNPK